METCHSYFITLMYVRLAITISQNQAFEYSSDDYAPFKTIRVYPGNAKVR